MRSSLRAAASVMLVAATAATVGACGGDDGDSGKPAAGGAAKTKLEVVKGAFFAGTFPNLPEAVALKQGFFTEEGIKYEPITLDGGGAQQGAALASGSIDIAPQEVRAVAVANSKGGKFRMVVGGFRDSLYRFVMSKDWKMPSLAQGYPAIMNDLKGAKIGITSLGSGTDFVISVLLREAHLKDDYLQRVAVGSDPRQVLAAIEAGRIDGFLSFEPTTSLLTKNGNQVILDTTKGEGPPIFKQYMSNGYTTTTDTAAKKPEQLKKFAAAIVKSIAFIKDPANEQAVADAFTSSTDVGKTIPPDVIAEAIKRTRDTYSPYIVESRYPPQVKLLEDLGFLQPGKAPPFDQIIAEGIMPTDPSGEK